MGYLRKEVPIKSCNTKGGLKWLNRDISLLYILMTYEAILCTGIYEG